MDDTLTADGFDDAIIGYVDRCSQPRIIIYSWDRCVDILMFRDGMTETEAAEYLSYNFEGAWLGSGTPGLLHTADEATIRDDHDPI